MPPKMSATEAEPLAPGEELPPVLKSIRVKATPDRAYRVFTSEMDSWWPRTHHIGSSPMKRVVLEPHPQGSIYTDQEDGTICPWGTVLVWDPPHRFVMAWRVTPTWQYEHDLSRCSEVELRFTPADDGTTLVELEHRNIHLHGAGSAKMRESVGSEGGWGGLLAMFAAKAEQAS